MPVSIPGPPLHGPARARACLDLALALALLLPAGACAQAGAAPGSSPRWGAIATAGSQYGYAFDHGTRAAAEQDARGRCERALRRSGACTVRIAFDRGCAALALGNYGEWAVAAEPSAQAAAGEAARRCDEHLPAEPCKVMLRVCSRP